MAIITYLIQAGGGGGGVSDQAGSGSGGGGGGQTIIGTFIPSIQIYPVTVGLGGFGAFNPNEYPTNGGNSSVFGLTAIGGGTGGGYNLIDDNFYNPTPGGNGGGGANGQLGASGIINAGGNGISAGGGGGGSGGVGLNNSGFNAGNGGQGLLSSILGTPLRFGAGGGGGTFTGNIGLGGTERGGNGGKNGVIAGQDAGIISGFPLAGGVDITTGDGGGGGISDISGNGASGVIVLSYPTGSLVATGGFIGTIGGNTIHLFVQGTSFNFQVTGITGGNNNPGVKIFFQ